VTGKRAADSLDYASYLDIQGLLRHQLPRTDVPDEYLFIITHQAMELWFAEALHEVDHVVRELGADRVPAACRRVSRLRRIIELCTAHLDVLDTMPIAEFAAFRGALGRASGLQSGQFRELELASGKAERDVLKIANAVGAAGERLRARVLRPSIRQAFGHLLAREDITVRQVYRADGARAAEIRALAEELVEYDLAFNRWRHRHYLLVLHVIGGAAGTGGSSGARYLRNTTETWFFPEIWSARNMTDTDGTVATDPLTVPLDGSVSADRGLLGGKGWGLQQMHQLDLPVPPAFTITTLACAQYFADGREIAEKLWMEILDEVEDLERRAGSRFGGSPPLLVSVRSGAPVSMPGMMDTVLNIGLTPAALDWLGAERGAVALRDMLASRVGERPTDDPVAPRDHALGQLRTAITHVLDSWYSDRAKIYRAANHIDEDLGTAVTVQAMVFGNLDERSGTGVLLTRDPITGAREPYGEWLPMAQGEDLVAGTRTPVPLHELRTALPEVYEQLTAFGERLERMQRNVLEVEFTVESGTLHLLQVRNASGTPEAAARWAVDLVRAGVIDIPEALARVPVRDAGAGRGGGVAGELVVLAEGVGVSPGVRTGRVAGSVEDAADLADRGEPVLLGRATTSPHDLPGFLTADGVLTDHGGSTSHAAVVARQLGLPCVVGCGAGTAALLAGQVVTIDGGTGRVYAGDVVADGPDAEHGPGPFALLARWRADHVHS
jgi:pyruvate, orthophosphate dikinase